MPNIKKMKQTMLDQGIPRETIAQIASVVDKDKTPLENITAFIGQMDSLLSRGQCLAIMEEQGCHKTERVVAPFRAFGQAHADQPIEEKIGLLAEIDTIYGYRCRLNPDETLSVYQHYGKEGNYRCLCTPINKQTGPVQVSDIYCGCCGGHARHNLQDALGVKLRLVDVVSSPISTSREEPCVFTFEIVP